MSIIGIIVIKYHLLEMNTGKIITQLRDQFNWSQSDLANKSDVSRVMIGKYERGEAVPSLDAAKKIADAFEVTLDYLVGESKNISFDKKTLKRFEDLQLIDESKRNTLFDLIDTYIRDSKTRQAYAS
jgi:transcriptional regulator with XRE-family HTH domain